MPWPTYSETFLRVSAQGTWGYIVPEGRRAVVKSITVMSFAAPPCAVWVLVGGLYVSYFDFQVANVARLQELMAVAYAGQRVEVQINKAGMHTSVSGFLLHDDSGASSAGAVERSLLPEHLQDPAEPK